MSWTRTVRQELAVIVICGLVFWPITVYSSTATATASSQQRPLAALAYPKLYTEPPMRDATERIISNATSGDASRWTSEIDLNSGAIATLAASKQPLSIPCLRRIFTGRPMEGHPEPGECVELPEEAQNFSFDFGRQLGAGSGTLGEVDGILVDYRVGSRFTLNGVAGYSVLSPEDKFNTSRQVVGISADWATLGRFWNLSSYILDETDIEGTNSRAVGGAIRYSRPQRLLLFYSDYDIAQESLNAFMATGTWMLDNHTRISAAIDIRNSPLERRQQIYLRQSIVSVQGGRWMLPYERIKQLFTHGEKGISTLALGLSHAFSQRLTLSGDIAAIEALNDDEAGQAPPQASYEYVSHLELNARNLMVSGDSNVLDLHHRMTNSWQVSSLCIRSQYDINRRWSINPRFSADYRSTTQDNSAIRATSSIVQMEYRWRRSSALRFEFGGNWSYEKAPNRSNRYSTYFLAFGYQTQF